MRHSTCWKVLTALAALAAAGAAVCWLIRSKKNAGCCLFGKKTDGNALYDGEDLSSDEEPQTTPCEEFSDGTAAEDRSED